MSADALAVRLLAIFVEELDEQVVQMGSDLTALGRTPGDAERLRSIFRVMHTLKGASRAAGVPLIEQLCHVLESGLAHAKERATPLSADQHALLVESVDALADARERLAAGMPVAGATLASLIQRARGGAGGGRPDAGARTATPPLSPAPVPSRQPSTPPAAPAPPPTDPSAPRDESMRISVGPGHILMYLLQGLFHPAKRIREAYWRLYNLLYIGAQDALVPFLPLLPTYQDEASYTIRENAFYNL